MMNHVVFDPERTGVWRGESDAGPVERNVIITHNDVLSAALDLNPIVIAVHYRVELYDRVLIEGSVRVLFRFSTNGVVAANNAIVSNIVPAPGRISSP
jgi:hypothetical protein